MSKERSQATRTDTQTTDVSQSLPRIPHTLEASKLVKELNSNIANGLSESDAITRLDIYGPNRLKPPKRPSLVKICLRQIANSMTLVLIAAMAVSFGTTDWISGGVIAALVAINCSVGTYTEWQSEKTVASLESVGAPRASIRRDKSASEITSDNVVPGDILLLKNGDIIAADGRIIEHSNLECDEAFLTGESLPVAKTLDPIEEEDCPVGDRTSMVFSGSQVTKGRAVVIVTATGMHTEIGKIAAALEKKAERNEKGFQHFWYRAKVILGLAETTSLQIKLNKLAYFLLGCSCVIAIIVVASTAFRNVPLSIATYAVASAVSILPASLIAVVSLTLARASTDLAQRHALVRRMDAIETLAGVSDVCSDKTGTLTVGRMVLRKFWVPSKHWRDDEPAALDTTKGQLYSVDTGSDPYYPRGDVLPIDSASGDESPVDDNEKLERTIHHEHLEQGLLHLTLCASLCNQATISRSKDEEDKGAWTSHGDPTEVALQVAAHKLGHGKPHLTSKPKMNRLQQLNSRRDSSYSRHSANPAPIVEIPGHYMQLVEHPFDSTVKRMSIAYRFIPANNTTSDGEHVVSFMKGAVERVLDRCTHIRMNQGNSELTEKHKKDIMDQVEELAEDGLRVLALCGKRQSSSAAEVIKGLQRDQFEQGFSFLGLAGIYDPPRKESAGAVADCHRAGITPRMLTGDHPATATAIALSIGILPRAYGKSAVMTGQQFDALSNDEVDGLPELPLVVARCAPETKVRMVDAIHRRKRTTIMTGDGVNDSPSLKRADVGVAMGTGSDVAKQSARIVLADDNFATIIRALRKGRSVFKNLMHFLLYLLSGNLAEIIVLLIGLAFKDRNGLSVFPLSPVAALWINTLAAGPPALALGLEPTAKDAMDLPPTSFHHIFTLEWYLDLIYYGFLMGSLTLVNFVIVLWGYFDGELGVDCNEDPRAQGALCDPVAQARGTCFATLVIILMIHALECKHMRKGIFQIDLRNNYVLLWSVALLALTTFPIIYIPRINDDVFLVESLGWEWGIVFAAIFVYLAFTELYKWAKRVFIRRRNRTTSTFPYDKTLRMADTIAPGQRV